MMFLTAVAKRSGGLRMNETMRVIMTAVCGIVIGFFVGASFPRDSLPKFTFPSALMANSINLQFPEDNNASLAEQVVMNSGHASEQKSKSGDSPTASTAGNNSIYVPTNPRGAETLAPGIVVAETDLYLRRLWGFTIQAKVPSGFHCWVCTEGYCQYCYFQVFRKFYNSSFPL